ncbi:carbohydrate ABC transporter permease [Streptomyces atroolivaceus]|uniref:carbohydrate ABC transporter permease n=1 Tax=Streptomyces atroolivaceus TaxID=66869 RepID=UPI0020243A62|nr:sugar ABC transporter permease [Streptomyces atroolivaceus]
MSTSSQLLSRRSFGRLAAGVAGAAGMGALGACTTGGGRPGADTPLRIMAINHVWSQAIRRRTKEFEELIGRRVSMILLTADQLASSYNVKLNASGTDVDVMMVRALQEQLLLLAGIGLPRQEFLGSVSQSLPTLMLIDVWQWTPMMTLLLLAGLTTLPEEPEEAARVDGANGWQRFRHVVLPMLGPTLATALVLRAVDALKTFDILYATKGAGGGSDFEVETLNVYAYGLTFDYQEHGLAAAVLVLFTLFIIGVVVLLRRRGGRKTA